MYLFVGKTNQHSIKTERLARIRVWNTSCRIPNIATKEIKYLETGSILPHKFHIHYTKSTVPRSVRNMQQDFMK
jgi:hypothetical protein